MPTLFSIVQFLIMGITVWLVAAVAYTLGTVAFDALVRAVVRFFGG